MSTKYNFKTPLSNFELMQYAKQNNIQLDGVIMKDELLRSKSNSFYIVNLESSTQSGTHWCALVILGKKAYWSDSFGMPPPQSIIDSLNIKSSDFFYNDIQIQDTKSIYCGFFSLAFLLYLQRGSDSINKRITSYLTLFAPNEKNYKNNDKFIKNLFLQL